MNVVGDSSISGPTFPLVSICIPTYNRAINLKAALESAVKQDYPNLEIVVLDNASTDNTQTVVAEFIEKDTRIRYHKNKENIGATNNFNAVADLATGDYLMWLADDDWIEANYLSLCMKEYAHDQDLALVSGLNDVQLKDGVVKRGQVVNLPFSNAVVRVLVYYALAADNGFFYGVHRRSTIDQVTLVDRIGCDWLYIAATAYRGKIKTVKGTMLHRSGTGASSNVESLAKSHGLPRICQLEPYLAVALEASKDLWNNDPAFGDLSRISRGLLSATIFTGIFVKKVIIQKIYRFFRDACYLIGLKK